MLVNFPLFGDDELELESVIHHLCCGDFSVFFSFFLSFFFLGGCVLQNSKLATDIRECTRHTCA